MRIGHALALLSLTVLPAAASAQQDRPAYVRALAAGYKASFVCSNLFNGGLSEAQTAADDLTGTYDSLTPLFAEARGAGRSADAHRLGRLRSGHAPAARCVASDAGLHDLADRRRG